MSPKALGDMRERREELHERVHAFAVKLGLPDDPEGFFAVDPESRKGSHIFESSTEGEEETGETASGRRWISGSRDRSQKGRVRGRWDAIRRFVVFYVSGNFTLTFHICAPQVFLDCSPTEA